MFSVHFQKFSSKVFWAFFQSFIRKVKTHFQILKKNDQKKFKNQALFVQLSWQRKAGSKSVNKTDLTEGLLSGTTVKSGVDQSVLNLWLLTMETWHRSCNRSQKTSTIHLCWTQYWYQQLDTKKIHKRHLSTHTLETPKTSTWIRIKCKIAAIMLLFVLAGNCLNENGYITPYPAASDYRIPRLLCLLPTNVPGLLHFSFLRVFLFNGQKLTKILCSGSNSFMEPE